MKKTLLIIFILSSFFSYSQNSNITGVVTYFFNKYQGDKPDIGAKVYVIDSIGNSEFNFELIEQFQSGKLYRSLYDFYARMYAFNEALLKQYGKKKRYAKIVKSTIEENEEYKLEMDEFYKKMVELNVETDEKFKELDKQVFNSYRKTLNKDNIVRRTIGANGDYSIPVKSGTYYVFIVSKNRTGLTMSEVLGKIYCKKVRIEDGQIKDISYNFRVN